MSRVFDSGVTWKAGITHLNVRKLRQHDNIKLSVPAVVSWPTILPTTHTHRYQCIYVHRDRDIHDCADRQIIRFSKKGEGTEGCYAHYPKYVHHSTSSHNIVTTTVVSPLVAVLA